MLHPVYKSSTCHAVASVTDYKLSLFVGLSRFKHTSVDLTRFKYTMIDLSDSSYTDYTSEVVAIV